MHSAPARQNTQSYGWQAGTLRIARPLAGALPSAPMQQPARPSGPQTARDCDFQRRLARFRSRVAGEARPNALKVIDAAAGEALEDGSGKGAG